MFPSYDLNPGAIHHMQQEQLNADIDLVDGKVGRPGRTSAAMERIRGAGLYLALLVVAIALI